MSIKFKLLEILLTHNKKMSFSNSIIVRSIIYSFAYMNKYKMFTLLLLYIKGQDKFWLSKIALIIYVIGSYNSTLQTYKPRPSLFQVGSLS